MIVFTWKVEWATRCCRFRVLVRWNQQQKHQQKQQWYRKDSTKFTWRWIGSCKRSPNGRRSARSSNATSILFIYYYRVILSTAFSVGSIWLISPALKTLPFFWIIDCKSERLMNKVHNMREHAAHLHTEFALSLRIGMSDACSLIFPNTHTHIHRRNWRVTEQRVPLKLSLANRNVFAMQQFKILLCNFYGARCIHSDIWHRVALKRRERGRNCGERKRQRVEVWESEKERERKMQIKNIKCRAFLCTGDRASRILPTAASQQRENKIWICERCVRYGFHQSRHRRCICTPLERFIWMNFVYMCVPKSGCRHGGMCNGAEAIAYTFCGSHSAEPHRPMPLFHASLGLLQMFAVKYLTVVAQLLQCDWPTTEKKVPWIRNTAPLAGTSTRRNRSNREPIRRRHRRRTIQHPATSERGRKNVRSKQKQNEMSALAPHRKKSRPTIVDCPNGIAAYSRIRSFFFHSFFWYSFSLGHIFASLLSHTLDSCKTACTRRMLLVSGSHTNRGDERNEGTAHTQHRAHSHTRTHVHRRRKNDNECSVYN